MVHDELRCLLLSNLSFLRVLIILHVVRLQSIAWHNIERIRVFVFFFFILSRPFRRVGFREINTIFQQTMRLRFSRTSRIIILLSSVSSSHLSTSLAPIAVAAGRPRSLARFYFAFFRVYLFIFYKIWKSVSRLAGFPKDYYIRIVVFENYII